MHEVHKQLRRAEIPQLNVTIFIYQDSSRLQVADNNSPRVAKGEPIHNLLGEAFDSGLRQRLVLLDEFEQVAARAVLSHSPHMVFCLHVVVESEDVGVMEFLQDFGLVQYFLLSRFVHALDGYELEFLLSARFEDD